MIKNVEEGINNFKRLLKKYLVYEADLVRRYRTVNLWEVCDPSHLQRLSMENAALLAVANALGFTKEERDRIYKEVKDSL